VYDGSNGFVLPLIDWTMSGTPLAPERVFQYVRAGTWAKTGGAQSIPTATIAGMTNHNQAAGFI
jgi:hypothetical protein